MIKITKAFDNEKEKKDFKKKYSNGDINTEVISNILQPHYSDASITATKYLGFLQSKHGDKGLVDTLRMMVAIYGGDALFDFFGTHDFNFEGNRKYKNHILKLNDLIVICPDKREVVFADGMDPYGTTIMNKVISFEKQYFQLVMNYVVVNIEKVSPKEKELIVTMKEVGLLSEEGKINFKYGLEELVVKKPFKMK